jgi:hypothetical protein
LDWNSGHAIKLLGGPILIRDRTSFIRIAGEDNIWIRFLVCFYPCLELGSGVAVTTG